VENKQADKKAKNAITDGSSNHNKLPQLLKKILPWSKSATKWAYGKKLKQHAQKLWQVLPHYEQMKKTDLTAMSNKYPTLITPLPRKVTSILTQMRTEHTPLAKHFHHIGKAGSPTCPTCQQHEETVKHLLLHCPAH
jgi:hypothetical protein